jgi:hypothetical protein
MAVRQYQAGLQYVNEATTRQHMLGEGFLNDASATPATTYTFTGPTTGVVNAASTNFTVTPDGEASGITVTPASDGTGTFTPSSVTFSGSDAATFTYTPTSTSGSPHTISVSDDGGLTDPASIDYEVTVGTISCTDETAGRVYQRVAGGTTKTVTLAGTYTGTDPTTVEVKIVAQSGGATVQDWTALSSASIAGGNWSGTLSIPQGGWYNFLARGKDAGGSVLFTSSQTSNKWGVGIIVALIGQSNMELMNTRVSSPPASDDLSRQYTTAGGWAVVAGNGCIRFCNQLQDGVSLPVAVLPYGRSSTTVAQWIDTSHIAWTNFTTALTAVGGDCEFVLWHQGESDAIPGTTKANYKSRLTTLYSNIRTATGRSTTTLKFGCALLGTITDATATDATTDAIRQGQLEWIDETTGAFFAGSSVDMVLLDDYHWTAPYYERMGRRYAQAILHQLGLVGYGSGGPRVLRANRTLGEADVILTINHDGGASLEELDGSTDGGSVTGFQVSDDDFSTTLTISSTAFDGNTVVLTLSATPDDLDVLKVRYQYGETPSITNPVYDNLTVQGDTLGFPLRPTTGSITVTEPSTGSAKNMLLLGVG